MVAAALARNRRRAPTSARSASPTCPACGSNAEVLAHHGLDARRRIAATRSLQRVAIRHASPFHWIRRSFTGSTTPRSRRRAARRSRSARPIDDRVVARGGARRRRRRGARRRRGGARPRTRGARMPAPRAARSSAAPPRCCARSEREFGEIVQAETGKPWKNAVAEVASSADLARLHGRRRQPLLRQDDDEPDSESRGAHRARADRRLRGDHAVQQPAGRRRLEGVSGAAVRQRRRGEVARADAVHRGRVRQAAAGSRAAARRVLGGAGTRSRSRHAARSRTSASASSASPDRSRPAS